MKAKILITDTLFIGPKHEKMLTNAGYGVERLPKLKASEAELRHAVKGKVGYILGGIELVTTKVINAAESLGVISFTGNDFKRLIPAWDYASQKGIQICNTPDAFTQSVAEWALAVTLMMTRELLATGRGGPLVGSTVKGIEGQKVGIIGYGRIGKRIARLIAPFHPKTISYYNRHKEKRGRSNGPQYRSLSLLLKSSDIIFLCIPSTNTNFFGKKEFSRMKDKALLVSVLAEGIINEEALLNALTTKKIRAAIDYSLDKRFNHVPFNDLYYSNVHTAFNTEAVIDKTSYLAVKNLLLVLEAKHKSD